MGTPRGGQPPDSEGLSLLSPRHLAYLGDAVYELHVRKRLLTEAIPVEQLHRAKVSKVKASAQAAALRELMPSLTAAEADVVRRARNLKTAVPRSASVAEYRYSTAFEALIGHLYLNQEFSRLEAILEAVDAFMDRSASGSNDSASPNASKEEAPHGGSSH
ncbi:Mini-ribonuclease 3 [compost metagenome]